MAPKTAKATGVRFNILNLFRPLDLRLQSQMEQIHRGSSKQQLHVHMKLNRCHLPPELGNPLLNCIYSPFAYHWLLPGGFIMGIVVFQV